MQESFDFKISTRVPDYPPQKRPFQNPAILLYWFRI